MSINIGISLLLFYRGYVRDMVEGTSASCSTLRSVVKALWCSTKSHWHEPEGKAEGAQQKERRTENKQAARDTFMQGAEWLLAFLNAEK